MLERLNDLIDRGVIHSVFIGKSVTAQPRFATLKAGAGETVASGKGQTCAEALQDALDRVGKPQVQHQEPEVQTMPGVMPGLVTR